MSPTSFVVRSTTLLSSLAITALAIAIIYKTGNAFLRLTTDFPPGSYVWKGVDEANEFLEPWDDEVRDGKALVARIYYAWSTEYMTWVAAGASIVAGLLGVAIEAAMAVGKQRRSGNGSAISTAVGVTAIGFATIAFVASMFAALWAYYQHYEFGRGCAWNLSEDVQSVYTCTSELATCDMWQFFSNRRDLGARGGICSKMRFGRHALIPLTVLSGVVVVGYGVQTWLARRGQSKVGWNGEEKPVQEKLVQGEE